MTERIPPTLLTLPDVAVKNILDHCDFIKITKLRKVCRDLRNFIEDTKPEPYHGSLDIIVQDNFVRLQTCIGENPWLYPEGEWIWIQYTKEEVGCSVDFVKDKKVSTNEFPDEDFMDLFFQDFTLNFGTFKATLPEFYLNLGCRTPEVQSRFLENFESILKSRIRPLKVRTFQMAVEDPEPVSKILSLIDKDSLRTINLECVLREPRQLDVKELTELDNWKAAEKFWMAFFHVSGNIEHFYTFKKGQVKFDNLPAEEIVKLKNEFLQNPILHHFQLFYETISNESLLDDTFGQPFLQTDSVGNKKNWTFSIPGTDNILSVSLYSSFVAFLRIKGNEADQKLNPNYFEEMWS